MRLSVLCVCVYVYVSLNGLHEDLSKGPYSSNGAIKEEGHISFYSSKISLANYGINIHHHY